MDIGMGGTGWATSKSQKSQFSMEFPWLLSVFMGSVLKWTLSPSVHSSSCASSGGGNFWEKHLQSQSFNSIESCSLPEISVFRGISLAPECFHGICARVDTQSFNTFLMLVPLQVAGISGKNTSNLLKALIPSNPALCSRNVVLTQAQHTVVGLLWTHQVTTEEDFQLIPKRKSPQSSHPLLVHPHVDENSAELVFPSWEMSVQHSKHTELVFPTPKVSVEHSKPTELVFPTRKVSVEHSKPILVG